MKLYSYWRSSTSYRVRIALNLKELTYATVPVDLTHGGQISESYRQINPYGTVPTLEVDGQILVQSMAILEWLEQTFPSPALLPIDDDAAQTCREFYAAIASEIHAPNNMSVLTYLRCEFGAEDAAIARWNRRWIARTFEPVENRLNAIDWACSQLPFGAPSLFEIVLIPQMYNARRWNTDLRAYPNLCRIEAYCQGLEAFQTARPEMQPDAKELQA